MQINIKYTINYHIGVRYTALMEVYRYIKVSHPDQRQFWLETRIRIYKVSTLHTIRKLKIFDNFEELDVLSGGKESFFWSQKLIKRFKIK
jgi:hypothetical protein